MLNRVGPFVNKVAKAPRRESYIWDEQRSIVAAVLFWAVSLLRLVSPLQWVKFWHRCTRGRDRLFQKRTNFHALYTELYFLALILILGTIYHGHLFQAGALGTIVRWGALYLAAEAVLWATYYLFFRHFIEGTFTIYNHAEYFLAFPLALTVQLLGLAVFLQLPSVWEPLAVLFNLSSTQQNGLSVRWETTLAVLGVFYVVVLLTNLRDAFPKTMVKPVTAVAIIGAGEVVRTRLLPALVNPLPFSSGATERVAPVEINRRVVHVFDLGRPGDSPKALEFVGQGPHRKAVTRRVPVKIERSPLRIVTELASLQVPTIVATPPDSHFYYINLLSLQGIRFAVEKPISLFEPEVHTLASAAGAKLFDDGFAMSYYMLEKALPLTYLYRMHPVHRDYLDIQVPGSRKADRASLALPWNAVIPAPGLPQRITVLLLEGTNRSPRHGDGVRAWTEDPQRGGLFHETAIHAISVVQKALGSLAVLADVTIESQRYSHAVGSASTFAWLSNAPTHGDRLPVHVDLFVGKYIPESLCARGVIIEYVDRTVVCDFDTMHLQARSKGTDSLPIVDVQVGEQYRDTPYAVQTSLIRTFFEYGWRGERFDDFVDQCQVLKWLTSKRGDLDRSERAMTPYDARGNGLPPELALEVQRYRLQSPRLHREPS